MRTHSTNSTTQTEQAQEQAQLQARETNDAHGHQHGMSRACRYIQRRVCITWSAPLTEQFVCTPHSTQRCVRCVCCMLCVNVYMLWLCLGCVISLSVVVAFVFSCCLCVLCALCFVFCVSTCFVAVSASTLTAGLVRLGDCTLAEVDLTCGIEAHRIQTGGMYHYRSGSERNQTQHTKHKAHTKHTRTHHGNTK